MNGLVLIPWTFKPIFGYMYDKFVNKFQTIKVLLFISCLIRIFINLELSVIYPSFFYFVIILFLRSFAKLIENISCEFILVKMKKGNPNDEP
mgnify:CR=1 FL=1